MLAKRRRRWDNISPALGQRLVFAWTLHTPPGIYRDQPTKHVRRLVYLIWVRTDTSHMCVASVQCGASRWANVWTTSSALAQRLNTAFVCSDVTEFEWYNTGRQLYACGREQSESPESVHNTVTQWDKAIRITQDDQSHQDHNDHSIHKNHQILRYLLSRLSHNKTTSITSSWYSTSIVDNLSGGPQHE